MKFKFTKKILFALIFIICIIISLFAGYFLKINIDNKKEKIKDSIVGSKDKIPEGFTFLEGLGLTFLTSGLSYQFGVTPDFVEQGFNALLTTNFEETEIATQSNAINDYSNLYEKKIKPTKELNKEITDENDITYTYILPSGITEENIETTSNAWILNYRFYKNGLTGLSPSYWYSQLFSQDIYFDRAWNSLTWMCEKYLNCVIVENNQDNIKAIFYSNDVYWYLYLDKLYNENILNINKKVNCFSMRVEPIKEENAVKLLKSKNLIVN